jgi:Family of unknown function (DUF6962)
VKLAEPTTVLTDYFLAAETILLAILLLRDTPSLPVRLWAFSFFFLAVAAIAGGTYHGFIHTFHSSMSQRIWKITLYAIGIATFLMLVSISLAYFHGLTQKTIVVAAASQFVLYSILMARSDDFRFVIYNYGAAMIFILVVSTFVSNQWFIGGVVISFAGAAVQRSGIQLYKNFNFNDIYHLIQMVGMYFFYRGGKLLQPN